MTAQPLDLWSARIHAYAERKPMGRQLKAVFQLMSAGDWTTFTELRDDCQHLFSIGISEAGVSARIRDLRKPCYGDHKVERKATDHKGIFAYRLVR